MAWILVGKNKSYLMDGSEALQELSFEQAQGTSKVRLPIADLQALGLSQLNIVFNPVFDETPPASQKTKQDILLPVAWFPQTDNFTQPDRTCNSSSCAMLGNFFEPNKITNDDDYLRKVIAIGDTTDHTVQTRVLRSYGINSVFRKDLTFTDLDSELAAGRPVVISFLHRGSLHAPRGGHVAVIRGSKADGSGYFLNDPYGSLNDGYQGPVTNGRSVFYSREVLRLRWLEPAGHPRGGWGRLYLGK
jgi:hypothetical protein